MNYVSSDNYTSTSYSDWISEHNPGQSDSHSHFNFPVQS